MPNSGKKHLDQKNPDFWNLNYNPKDWPPTSKFNGVNDRFPPGEAWYDST